MWKYRKKITFSEYTDAAVHFKTYLCQNLKEKGKCNYLNWSLPKSLYLTKLFAKSNKSSLKNQISRKI